MSNHFPPGFPPEIAALDNWLFSDEGMAAGKAAIAFAQRVGIKASPAEIGAILVAAHVAEEQVRRKKTP